MVRVHVSVPTKIMELQQTLFQLPDAESLSKVCSKCYKRKSIDEFHRHPRGRYGCYPSCKICRRINFRLIWTRDNYKICSKCGIEKLFDEFSKNSRSPYGVRSDCRSCQAEWRRNNKHIMAEFKHARRAKLANVKSGPKPTIEEMLRLQDGKCVGCGKEDGMWEMDHIIPINPRLGDPQGNDTVDNVQVLCRECNRRKNNKPIKQWLEEIASIT